VKRDVRHKGDGSRFIIFACYSWGMTLDVGLDVSFDNVQGYTGIRVEGKVDSPRVHVASDEACWATVSCCCSVVYRSSQRYLRSHIVQPEKNSEMLRTVPLCSLSSIAYSSTLNIKARTFYRNVSEPLSNDEALYLGRQSSTLFYHKIFVLLPFPDSHFTQRTQQRT
jgi:hypothetical protein